MPPDGGEAETADTDTDDVDSSAGSARAPFDYEARQKMLNQNQVLAAAHFVRRLKAFMKHLMQYPPLLGGKLTDYVIRYETQGRGSVHAHLLLWIKMDPKYIPESDVIRLDPELVMRYGLAVRKCERCNPTVEDLMLATVESEPDPSDQTPTQAAGETPHDSGRDRSPDQSRSASPEPGTQVSEDDIVRLYNEQYLSYTNANVWALKDPENIRRKLHIGLAPIDSLS